MDCYTKFFMQDREGEEENVRNIRERMGQSLLQKWWSLENADRNYYLSEEEEDERANWYYEQELETLAVELDRTLTREEEKECERRAIKKMNAAQEQRNIEELIEQQLEALDWKKGDVFDDYNEEAPYHRMMEQRAVDRDRGRW